MVFDPITWIAIGSLAGFGAVDRISKNFEEDGYDGDQANLAGGKAKPKWVHNGKYWQKDDGLSEPRPAPRRSPQPRPAPRQQDYQEYTPPRQSAPRRGGGEVVIPADSRGHYILNCSIEGVKFQSTFDTGATNFVLTQKTFQSVTGESIRKFKANSSANTANGRVPMTVINMQVTAEGITIDDVEVGILHGNGNNTNLLGMAFTSRLSECAMRNGQLIMRR